jgi:hypothetical protein
VIIVLGVVTGLLVAAIPLFASVVTRWRAARLLRRVR